MTLNLYAIRNNEGKWFAVNKHARADRRWVTRFDWARVWNHIRGARITASRMSRDCGYTPTVVCLHVTQVRPIEPTESDPYP